MADDGVVPPVRHLRHPHDVPNPGGAIAATRRKVDRFVFCATGTNDIAPTAPTRACIEHTPADGRSRGACSPPQGQRDRRVTPCAPVVDRAVAVEERLAALFQCRQQPHIGSLLQRCGLISSGIAIKGAFSSRHNVPEVDRESRVILLSRDMSRTFPAAVSWSRLHGRTGPPASAARSPNLCHRKGYGPLTVPAHGGESTVLIVKGG